MIGLLTPNLATVLHDSASRARARRSGEAAPAPRALGLFLPEQSCSHHGGGRWGRWDGRLARHHFRRAIGFTLLEVMLAVVILGLGILGLSALFAGAARQQKTSNEIVRSVAIGLNTKAALERKLGVLEGVNPNITPPGQWFWIKSTSPTDPTLTVASINPTAYFRVSAPTTELYSAPADFMGGPPQGAVGMGQYTAGGQAPPFGNAVSDFPHERVIPSSLTMRVTISQQSGTTGGDQTFAFAAPNPPPDVPELVQNIILTRDGGPNTGDTITVNPGRLLQNGSTENAIIQSFSLNGLFTGGGTNQWISKIEALPYDWRSARLVSLNERLSYVKDGRFPPAGRRPELGYVLFFRQFGEINQAMVVIYSLLPQTRPTLNNDQFPLIPPDDQQSAADMDQPGTNALVRRVNAEFGWDDARKQYYMRVPNDEDNRWAVAPGQILLVEKNDGACPELSADPAIGADGVVRVISQAVETDGIFIRGYLDDIPRVGLQGLVPPGSSQTCANVPVFALQPEIVNADPLDDTRWKVRPVDARLIPIAAQ